MSVPATNKSSVLQRFVERANSLYSLPAVAVEVLELTDSGNVDASAICACVERDPALTAKLLRVVNSSMFGLSREVSDLKQALALLGVKPLKLLVLGFSLPKELYHGVEAQTLQQFWKYTLVKAVAARELSRAFWGVVGDEAFIAGLLQEIGVLVLVRELGDSYVSFLASVHKQGGDLAALETATLGFDHAILSARLLDHWSLPAALVDAVAAVQDVDVLAALDRPRAMLPQTLHLATMIASILVSGRGALLPDLLDAARRYRGLHGEQIDAVLDEMQEQVQLMSALFAVPVSEPEPYREIMARAHAQLSDAAVELLPQIVGTLGSEVWPQQQSLHRALDQYTKGLRVSSVSGAAAGQRPPVAATPSRCDVPDAVGRPQATGDPGLEGRLSVAIATCSARHRELSLVLWELDNYANLLVLFGPERVARMVAGVQRAIESLADTACESLIVSDSRLAVVLPDCDRQQAVQLARALSEAIPAWLIEQGHAETTLTFSVGISSLAAPTRSSRPAALLEAADRCLFASQRTGGGMIKSIDVF